MRPLRAELVNVEQRITSISARLPLLETDLAEPSLYEAGNKSRLDNLLDEQFALAKEGAILEARWLELTAVLEAS